MTALTEDKKLEYMEGTRQALPVASGATIYTGALVCMNTSGEAVPATDTAGLKLAGWAVDQPGHDNMVVVHRKGIFRVALGTTLDQTNVGNAVYIVDDQTVDLAATTTNDGAAGVIVEILNNGAEAFIDIEPALNQLG